MIENENKIINSFRGKYRFLSNFHECEIGPFRSTEAAYQAFKSNDENVWKKFADLTPFEAKKLGNQLKLRSDWEEIKEETMYRLLLVKFASEELAKMLLDTGDSELIEGNTWHDSYWGNCICEKCGKGQNMLGKLLMKIRSELKEEKV